MEEKVHESQKQLQVDEVMLPGFRFHPTDEELVEFYLKRKIQQRSLVVELIKQLDIYKYDPWDLPNLAIVGEKEWYFCCPRDRKYRNSARPNRVTGAGFWKATGTDRPIYSSQGTKCIGLKKSLVFYRGRAARGVKTEWMMHEFRLPSLMDPTSATKRPLDENIPPNDSWAICRIFKKNNPTPQRAQSHNSWSSPEIETDLHPSALLLPSANNSNNQPSTEIDSSSHESTGSGIQFSCNINGLQTSSAAVHFSSVDFPAYNKPMMEASKGASALSIPWTEASSNVNVSPIDMLVSLSSGLNGDDTNKIAARINLGQHLTQHEPSLLQQHQQNEGDEAFLRKPYSNSFVNGQLAAIAALGFPFSLQPNSSDQLKPNLSWVYSSHI